MTNLKELFPQLNQKINGKRLVYLDNAATTLKLKSVVNVMSYHDLNGAANVHRGAHYLSDKATTLFEEARARVGKFINAKSPEEIIFTRGTTEGINLVASSITQMLMARQSYSIDDEILLTEMEHHSNIVPWQMAGQGRFRIKTIPVLENGELDMEKAKKLINNKTKVLSLVHMSNSLGTINPIEELIVLAKKNGALVVIDAAQSAAQIPLDVQHLDCDFLAFSGHKVFGPFGVGVLWGKQGLLDTLPPHQGGGSMIREVTFNKTTYLGSPHRFEAGTPNVTGALGLSEALRFFSDIDRTETLAHEVALAQAVERELRDIPSIRVVGSARKKGPIVSFVMGGVHAADLGHLLNEQGVAVRTGHHCCQPLMRKFGIEGTTRASFSIYNDQTDAEIFIDSIKKAARLLQ